MSDQCVTPMSHVLPTERVTALARSWLKEDAPNFDYDQFAIGEDVRKRGKARLFMKSPGAIAGIPFFDAVFKEVDCYVKWSQGLIEGDHFDCGNTVGIATIEGEYKNILLGEKIALNCLRRASGIATLAQKFVLQAHKQGCMFCQLHVLNKFDV